MLDAKLCMDPSLPEGYAIWLALHSQPQGIFLISGGAFEQEFCNFIERTKNPVHCPCSARRMLRRLDIEGNLTARVAYPTSELYGLVAAEAREDADGWVDGLLMTAHIAASQQLPALASALGAGS